MRGEKWKHVDARQCELARIVERLRLGIKACERVCDVPACAHDGWIGEDLRMRTHLREPAQHHAESLRMVGMLVRDQDSLDAEGIEARL